MCLQKKALGFFRCPLWKFDHSTIRPVQGLPWAQWCWPFGLLRPGFEKMTTTQQMWWRAVALEALGHLGLEVRRKNNNSPTTNKLEPATATRTVTTAALQSNAQPPPPPPPSPSPPPQLGLLFRLASCTAKQPSATTTTTVAETFLCFLGSRIVAKRPDIARVFWVVGKILSYCLMRHRRLEKRWWPSQKTPLRFGNQASFLQKVVAEVSCPNFLFCVFVRVGARCLVLCWFRGCDVVRPLLHTTLGWSTRWKSLGPSGLDGDVVGNFGMPIGSAWKILNSGKHL